MEKSRLGINEFLLKYSAPTSLSARAPKLEKFTIVVSYQKGSESEQFIKEELESKEWLAKVILVEEEEITEAMCGSDFGFAYDGQLVSRAAACHLPVGAVFDMRMHHQWYHDLFNRWWNDMAIIADNNIYPEIIGGEYWKGRIADQLANWYLKPETRFDLIRKWEYFLKDAMSFVPIDRSTVKTQYMKLEDGFEYFEYQEPFGQVSRHMLRDVDGHLEGERELFEVPL